jgi:hypothetical protein
MTEKAGELEIKLKEFQVVVPLSTIAQVSACASYLGISKRRLAGELLAKAVELYYEEFFGVSGSEAQLERPSAFEGKARERKAK